MICDSVDCVTPQDFRQVCSERVRTVEQLDSRGDAIDREHGSNLVIGYFDLAHVVDDELPMTLCHVMQRSGRRVAAELGRELVNVAPYRSLVSRARSTCPQVTR